ncbi:small integral membrane protein 8 [Lucilia sericata]|uniref:small integral membrane protein 8 n=1 Tax=Lucilia sericata TaxID=13632 RepID=UPI0018A8786D|nr:small integral membrane protein 8 [Lucilia sericata]
MADKEPLTKAQNSARVAEPGDGIRQVKTTNVFRLINFELYTRPNKIVMGVGLACITGVFGYITYMRWKYESLGYYTAVSDDGKEVFIKKESKWDT